MGRRNFKDSMVTRLILVFLLGNIFYVALFAILSSYQTRNKSEQYAINNLEEIIKEKSQLISEGFTQIEDNTISLGIWYQKIYINSDEEKYKELPKGYIRNENGTISRLKNGSLSKGEQSALYVASNIKEDSSLYRDIAISEELDDTFAKVVENRMVTWAYLIDKNNVLRCLPYSDLTAQFTSDHDQRKDPFYIDANEKNNPRREAVWTAPYSDYLRTGWTITCSYPIYNKDDEFYGVVCIDLSLLKLGEQYFKDFSIGKTGKIYWLTKEGNIYYQSGMTGDEHQGRLYSKNIFDEEKMGSDKRTAMKSALKGDSTTYMYTVKGSRKILFSSKVNDTDTVLLFEVDRSEFIPGKSLDANLLLILLLTAILMGVGFLTWLKHSFSIPMQGLVACANKISNGDYSLCEIETKSDLLEVRELNRAFTAMNASIGSYTKSLSEKNQEINTILETIEGALLIVKSDGSIVVATRESVAVTPEIIEKTLKGLKAHPQIKSEQIVSGTEVYRNTYYPICDSAGKLTEMVVSSNCVTQSVLLEKEVQQMEKMAGIGQFAAAIVHELKNHLAVIKGAVYILSMSNQSKDIKEEVDRIERAADEAEKVIYTLLDYSRDDEKMEMVHVGTVIKQILLLSRKTLIRQNIEVKEMIDDDCYINMGSPEALKVILQNIIINAIQAISEDGLIDIFCGRKDETIVVIVKNNGEPIPSELREKIFDPFYTTKADGNGIGLWITRRLTDALGGSVKVLEDDQNMTEFEIVLPVKCSRTDMR